MGRFSSLHQGPEGAQGGSNHKKGSIVQESGEGDFQYIEPPFVIILPFLRCHWRGRERERERERGGGGACSAKTQQQQSCCSLPIPLYGVSLECICVRPGKKAHGIEKALLTSASRAQQRSQHFSRVCLCPAALIGMSESAD